MSTPKKEFYEKQAATIIKNLEKRNMEGYYCPDAASAVQKALSLMPENSIVSWGGSMTLSEIGLMDALQNANYNLIDRMTATTIEEKREIYSKTVLADYYLMSTNAITLDGQLVNIDGAGNRVACLIHGPEHVIILAGMNKVESDVDSAMARVRNIAAPPNTVRLNCKTPCAVTGVCGDCLSPETICCQEVITRYSRIQGRIKVILIGEEYGY
ncbi:MAG: lactate utilization protein [Lachnospiraceae bacterium]|nr:lactate utilization protein [Lachnospiraceae bacterium]